MNVIEFLNTVGYYKDKQDYIKENAKRGSGNS